MAYKKRGRLRRRPRRTKAFFAGLPIIEIIAVLVFAAFCIWSVAHLATPDCDHMVQYCSGK